MNHFNGQNNDESRVIEFPEGRSIESEAAKWLAKLDTDSPTQTDIKGFKQWVKESDAHRDAFDRLSLFWSEVNIISQTASPRERAEQASISLNAGPWWNIGYALPAVALSFLMVTALTLFMPWQTQTPEVFTTDIGEQKTLLLPDGTAVVLNTNSEIILDYNAEHRGVKLLRGEALFDVFHDKSRPFDVYAGSGWVRAVGTAFSVYLRQDDVEVIVTEGVVEIGSMSVVEPGQMVSPDLSPVSVKAGSSAVFDIKAPHQVQLVEVEKIVQKLSWKEGTLLFKGDPLEQVVAEISRYTSLKIIIPERKMREMKVGGLFKVGDTESIFEALQESFGIYAEYVNDDFVYLISEGSR